MSIATTLKCAFERAARREPGGYFQEWPNGRISLELDDFDFHALVWALDNGRFPMATAKEAIAAAEARLETARFGLEDMRQRPERAQAGLMNAVVFGRMVTFALQNMRSTVSDFDEWYNEKRDEMRADPLMSFFYELRTQIEKKASRHTVTRTHITHFDSSALARFNPAPPDAVGFFIGDQSGGSGWKIRRPDGGTEKYYVDMPPEIAKTDLLMSAAPQPYDDAPAPDLLQEYLDRLQALIEEAKVRFLS